MRETGCTEVEVGLAVRLALERFRGARIQEFVTPSRSETLVGSCVKQEQGMSDHS